MTELYLEDFNYELSKQGGRQIKVVCPLCKDTRSNKGDRALSINRETKAYHCHYCQAKGVLKSKYEMDNKPMYQPTERFFKSKPKVYKKPNKVINKEESKYADPILDYFKDRGISEKTLKSASVTQELEYFPQLKARSACIAFNYMKKGELINTKYRTRNKHFKLISEAELILYNIDSIHPDSYSVEKERYAIVCEGEIDCLSFLEIGLNHVVSVPNGANANLSYLDDYIEEYIEPLDVIYIASDNDRKGLELRSELMRRFGNDKCRIIDYPESCKDANDVLVTYGKERLMQCFNEYTEIKPSGIQELNDVESRLDYLFHNGFQAGDRIGVRGFDDVLSFKVGLLYVVTGVPSHGKAISLDTPLPSPDGWINMGDIKLGDRLYDENGNICNVTFVTPIQHNRKCYKVLFSDNSEIICDAEHLWVTRDDKARRSEYRYKKRIEKNGTSDIQLRGSDQSDKRTYPAMRNTEEILNTLYVENGKRCNHAISVQGAIEGEKKNLIIDPYVLGVWLANGTVNASSFNTNDAEVVSRIESLGYYITKHSYKYQYSVKGLITDIKKYGINKEKRIPSAYLRADYDQRLELLKGLMDSDGCCMKDGTCSYSSSREGLANDVYELVMSMGLKATITKKQGKLNGVNKKMNFNINFRPNFNCFTLERKSCRIKDKYGDNVNWRYIKAITPVESVPVRCIQVDSPNHMYLCGKSMIPTHNTYALNFMLSRLNILHDWKIAFFSPEFYPTEDHVGQIMETLGGKRFSSKNYTQQEYETMKEYVCKNFFWLDPDNTDINDVMERAKYLVKRRGIKAIVIDPFNALTDKAKPNQKKDEYISDFLQSLRWFARKYGIAVFLVMHPTKQEKLQNGLYPVCDLYACKGASEIYDKADVGITVWRNKDEDYAEIHATKVKFRHLGKIGYSTFKFNINNGRYVEISDAEEMRKQGLSVRSMPVEWDNSNYIVEKIKGNQVQIDMDWGVSNNTDTRITYPLSESSQIHPDYYSITPAANFGVQEETEVPF